MTYDLSAVYPASRATSAGEMFLLPRNPERNNVKTMDGWISENGDVEGQAHNTENLQYHIWSDDGTRNLRCQSKIAL